MDNRVELKKTLNPASVWALALGSIIGWGCFILPGGWLEESGPMAAAIGVLLGGIMMYFIAISYGYMVKEFPVAGGEFAYAYGGYGVTHSYICGWMLTLGYLSIVPLNGTALGLLGRFVAPGLFAQGFLYNVAGFDVYLGEILLASFTMAFFAFFNYRGVEIMGRLQLVIVGLLCTAVLLITAGTLLSPHAVAANLQPWFAPDKSMWEAIIPILAISPFLFVGFDTIPQSAEEFDFPSDKTFKLMFWAILIGGLMYTAMVFNTALAMPYQELLAGKPAWATGQAVHVTLGKYGMIFLAVAVLMAIASGINGFFMATTRLLFGMGRARLVPSWFTDIHPKFNTPYKAILFVLIISLMAPWFGRKAIGWIVDMAAVGTGIGYMYTCLASAKMFSNNPHMEGASKNKFLGYLGAAFAVLIIALLTIPGSPAALSTPSWIAMAAWVGMGALFYMMKVKDFKNIPEKDMDKLILGEFDNIIKDKAA